MASTGHSSRDCRQTSSSSRPSGCPEIEFFAEHYVADADHSRRQIDLVARLVTNDDLRRRALEVAEIALKTRWACMNEIYRTAVLGERDPLPAGVAA